MNDHSKTIRALQGWVQQAAVNAGGLVVPVSGGSDGALAFWLCASVYPKKTRALHFGRKLRAEAWFKGHAALVLQPLPRIKANKDALRWALTASYALENEFWPVGSRNRTEQLLGTYSRASDAATVQPIIGLWKSDVLELCKYIGVPNEVLASSRKADPRCGRPRELTDIGIERIDMFVKVTQGMIPGTELSRFQAAEVEYLRDLMRGNRFKSKLPLCGPKI